MKPPPSYVPGTFETMMESFGVNLRRKTLREKFLACYREAEAKQKIKEATQTEILKALEEAGSNMVQLI